MKKIIFIKQSPFTIRDINFYEFEKYTDYNIELWNISDIVFPGNTFKVDNNLNIKIIDIIQKKDLYHKILNNKDSIFIIMVVFNLHTISMYRFLTRQKIEYFGFVGNPLPSISLKESGFIKYLKKVIGIFSLKHLLQFIIFKIPKKYFDIKGSKYGICAGGKYSLNSPSLIDENTKILYSHSYDYNNVIKTHILYTQKINKKYILFIDQNIAFHEDFKNYNLQYPVTEEKYYDSLNQFFTFLEKQYNLEVIIAVHPSFDIKKEKLFRGRKIFKGKTDSLISNAEFILLHCSTSISYIIGYMKKFIFITTNEINNHIWFDYIKEVNKQFPSKKIINIDNFKKEDIIKELKINNVEYKKYMDEYIKYPGSGDELFSTQLMNFIKENNL